MADNVEEVKPLTAPSSDPNFVPAGKFRWEDSYARRRPDEPQSHYNTRLKFIQALLAAEGSVISAEKVEVLSHSFSNVKYLKNKYPDTIMKYIERYDPTCIAEDDEPAAKKAKTDDDEGKEEGKDEGEANGEAEGEANGETKEEEANGKTE